MDRFCYIDDLEFLELIMLSGILIDYNVYMNVPSDIPVRYKFLPGSTTQTLVMSDSRNDLTYFVCIKVNLSENRMMGKQQ